MKKIILIFLFQISFFASFSQETKIEMLNLEIYTKKIKSKFKDSTKIFVARKTIYITKDKIKSEIEISEENNTEIFELIKKIKPLDLLKRQSKIEIKNRFEIRIRNFVASSKYIVLGLNENDINTENKDFLSTVELILKLSKLNIKDFL